VENEIEKLTQQVRQLNDLFYKPTTLDIWVYVAKAIIYAVVIIAAVKYLLF
jgi:hypothetical protein